jgi:uncharacterized phage protein gp47/JayE
MATFIRPTFTQILERIQADLDSRLPNADTRLRRSVLNVLSYMLAGVAHGLYGFISWISLQVFPDTAEVEFMNRWASIWGIIRIAAVKAAGNVTATGEDGVIIPVGTELQRSDNAVFVTTSEQTIVSGTATIPVEAKIAGVAGNTDAAVILAFVSPILNLDTDTTIDVDGLLDGADGESDASLLARLLDRIQQPPHGGNENDYIQWAKEILGVTRVWVYPQELAEGGLTIRFMMDDTYVDGIPLSGDVAAVQAYIDGKRPVTADVVVLAPVAVPLAFGITLVDQDSASIRAAVDASLRDLILREAEPAGTLFLSRINEAISLATGEFDHILTTPIANVTNTTGNITTMGVITWG